MSRRLNNTVLRGAAAVVLAGGAALALAGGALGLILPGLFHIQERLTPLAASGLVIIMIGAVVTTIAQGQGPAAIVPAVVGLVAAYVAGARSR